jgi:uncharacterized phage protein (TIGR01671 family)
MINKDRFKFRVFDKKKNRMYYEEQQLDFEYVLSQDNLVLMQCTGLRDKDGNLVYEGDILKPSGDVLFIINFETENAGFVIRYINNKKIENIEYDFCCENFNKIQDIEIIGNIYENSELY